MSAMLDFIDKAKKVYKKPKEKKHKHHKESKMSGLQNFVHEAKKIHNKHKEKKKEHRVEKAHKIQIQEKKLEHKEKKHEKHDLNKQNKFVKEYEHEAGKHRRKAQERGFKQGEEFFKRDIEGLSPEKRQAMQYEANKQINRQQHADRRRLLGEQSQRGILGKSGVAFAQQKALAKQGLEEKGAVHRDLDKLNSDLALKKLAAVFNVGQGEGIQSHLDRQAAMDQLQLAQEKRRQRAAQNVFYKSFSRI